MTGVLLETRIYRRYNHTHICALMRYFLLAFVQTIILVDHLFTIVLYPRAITALHNL
jgi:hypothetical protein